MSLTREYVDALKKRIERLEARDLIRHRYIGQSREAWAKARALWEEQQSLVDRCFQFRQEVTEQLTNSRTLHETDPDAWAAFVTTLSEQMTTLETQVMELGQRASAAHAEASAIDQQMLAELEASYQSGA